METDEAYEWPPKVPTTPARRKEPGMDESVKPATMLPALLRQRGSNSGQALALSSDATPPTRGSPRGTAAKASSTARSLRPNTGSAAATHSSSVSPMSNRTSTGTTSRAPPSRKPPVYSPRSRQTGGKGIAMRRKQHVVRRYHTTLERQEAVPGMTIVQNDLLQRYGGMEEECIEQLFLRIPNAQATLPSCLGAYRDVCHSHGLQPRLEIERQLPSIPGRYDLCVFNCAGIHLTDVEELLTIVPILSLNRNVLKEVGFRSCSLVQVDPIFDALEGSTSIVSLDLGSNCTLQVAAAMERITDFVPNHPTLVRLCLQQSSIPKAEALQVQELVIFNRKRALALKAAAATASRSNTPQPNGHHLHHRLSLTGDVPTTVERRELLALTKDEFDTAVRSFESLYLKTTGMIELETFYREMPTAFLRFKKLTATYDPAPTHVNFITFLQATNTHCGRAALLACVEAYSPYTPTVPVARPQQARLRDDYRYSVKSMFTVLDADGDGFLSREDLTQSLPEPNPTLVESVFEALKGKTTMKPARGALTSASNEGHGMTAVPFSASPIPRPPLHILSPTGRTPLVTPRRHSLNVNSPGEKRRGSSTGSTPAATANSVSKTAAKKRKNSSATSAEEGTLTPANSGRQTNGGSTITTTVIGGGGAEELEEVPMVEVLDKKTFVHEIAVPYLVDQRRRKRWKA